MLFLYALYPQVFTVYLKCSDVVYVKGGEKCEHAHINIYVYLDKCNVVIRALKSAIVGLVFEGQ